MLPPYLQGVVSGPPWIAKPLDAQIPSVKWYRVCTEPPYSLPCAVKLLKMTDTLSQCEWYIKIILLYRSREEHWGTCLHILRQVREFFQLILACDWLNYGGLLLHVMFETIKRTPSLPPFHTQSTKKWSHRLRATQLRRREAGTQTWRLGCRTQPF